ENKIKGRPGSAHVEQVIPSSPCPAYSPLQMETGGGSMRTVRDVWLASSLPHTPMASRHKCHPAESGQPWPRPPTP
ncbi:hypothetical protein CEXT_319951, partial [Caerostris extrusa]